MNSGNSVSTKPIIANFEIVTPMFLGGADHGVSRIRETSIKGALAFWWRVLNYSRFVEDARLSKKSGLELMQEEEQKLFGGGEYGQGAFLLRVTRQPDRKEIIKAKEVLKDSKGKVVGDGVRYLGYGLMEAFASRKKGTEAGELSRSCLKSGGSFEVQIIPNKPKFKSNSENKPDDESSVNAKSLDESYVIKEIMPALKLFGLLGGLGSRVRRGWGSVALLSLEVKGANEWKPPSNNEEYEQALKDIIGSLPNEEGRNWPVTAFAKESRIYLGTEMNKESLIALNRLGEGLLRYRAWGRNKRVGSVNVDASFAKDHDWFKKINEFSRGRGNYVPMRTAFGLPHNYSKDLGITAFEDYERRSSPLMFHICKMKGDCCPVLVFLPTKFLEKDKVAVNNRNNKDNKYYSFDPSVVTDFLEGCKHVDNKSNKPASPPAKNTYFPCERANLS